MLTRTFRKYYGEILDIKRHCRLDATWGKEFSLIFVGQPDELVFVVCLEYKNPVTCDGLILSFYQHEGTESIFRKLLKIQEFCDDYLENKNFPHLVTAIKE